MLSGGAAKGKWGSEGLHGKRDNPGPIPGPNSRLRAFPVLPTGLKMVLASRPPQSRTANRWAADSERPFAGRAGRRFVGDGRF